MPTPFPLVLLLRADPPLSERGRTGPTLGSKLLSKDEARRIAANIAKLPGVKFKSASRVTPMERDLIKLVDELFGPTEPQTTTETQKPVLLDSILPRLPSEGQAWLNGLNPFCRRAVEHDLRAVGPELLVQYWERLRDTLQKLERDFGPSDNWK